MSLEHGRPCNLAMNWFVSPIRRREDVLRFYIPQFANKYPPRDAQEVLNRRIVAVSRRTLINALGRSAGLKLRSLLTICTSSCPSSPSRPPA